MRYCGRGICAAEEGHEGTCDEASGWAPHPLDDPGTRRAIRQVRALLGKVDPIVWQGDDA